MTKGLLKCLTYQFTDGDLSTVKVKSPPTPSTSLEIRVLGFVTYPLRRRSKMKDHRSGT